MHEIMQNRTSGNYAIRHQTSDFTHGIGERVGIGGLLSLGAFLCPQPALNHTPSGTEVLVPDGLV